MLTWEERKVEIDAYLGEWIKPVFSKRSIDTINIFMANREKISQSLSAAIFSANETALPLFDLGKKQRIKHIQFSYLFSAALLKELLLRVDLYDAGYYEDLTDVKSYWDYKVLFPYITEDMEQLQTELSKLFPQIKRYEILDFRMYYHVAVFALLGEILKEIVADDSFATVIGDLYESEVTISYGGYQDHSIVLAMINGRLANGLFSNKDPS